MREEALLVSSNLELPHYKTDFLGGFLQIRSVCSGITVLYYCTTRVTSFPSEQRGKEGGREPKKKEYIYSNHLPSPILYQCCKKMLFFRQISKFILTLRITQRFDKFFCLFFSALQVGTATLRYSVTLFCISADS